MSVGMADFHEIGIMAYYLAHYAVLNPSMESYS